MSTTTNPALPDAEEQQIRTSRMVAETQKLVAEQGKLLAEQFKLMSENAKMAVEQVKLSVEATKLTAEADKLRRDRVLVPLLAAGAIAGATAAFVPLMLQGFGQH